VATRFHRTAFTLGCGVGILAAGAVYAIRRGLPPSDARASSERRHRGMGQDSLTAELPARRPPATAQDNPSSASANDAGLRTSACKPAVRRLVSSVRAAWAHLAGHRVRTLPSVLVVLTGILLALGISDSWSPEMQLRISSPSVALVSPSAAPPTSRQPALSISILQDRPPEGTRGGFRLVLRNRGDTPALQTFVTDYVTIEELDKLTGEQDAPSHRPVAIGTLLPGDTYASDVWYETSSEGVQSVVAGKVRVVNYTLVSYEDPLRARHVTRKCFYWHGGLDAPLPCEQPFAGE